MTTLNLQVGLVSGLNTDDADENASGGIDLTGLVPGFGGAIRNGSSIGLRFTGVSGLSGSTITAATLTFRANETDSGSFTGDWYAEDAVAPGTFTSSTEDITSRARTTATCEGDGVDFGDWTGGQDPTFTGDGVNTIVDIIQELADSYDPSTIVLLHIFTSGSGERIFKSYDSSSGTAPKLDITFTASGGDASISAVITTATALSPVSVWTADAKISAVITTASAISPISEITGTAEGTFVAVVTVATALSPVSVWTASSTLTAVITIASALSPAADIFSGVQTWQPFNETQFQVIREDFPTNAVFYLEILMTTSAPGNTVKARLYNVTDSTKVTGSEVTNNNTSPESSISGAFGFPSGTKTYRLEGGGETGGLYKWNIAKILVDW